MVIERSRHHTLVRWHDKTGKTFTHTKVRGLTRMRSFYVHTQPACEDSMCLSVFCDVRVADKDSCALLTLVHRDNPKANVELEFQTATEHDLWVQALTYLMQGQIAYVDDNIESKWLPRHVRTVHLQPEGAGITGAGGELALQTAGVDLAALRSTDIVIWDFDCTLSSAHLYKTLHMNSLPFWRQMWSPRVLTWWHEQCRKAGIHIN